MFFGELMISTKVTRILMLLDAPAHRQSIVSNVCFDFFLRKLFGCFKFEDSP